MAQNTFTHEELHLIREWFDAFQDLHQPSYLRVEDYVLAKKVYELCGMRVPDMISRFTGEQTIKQKILQ